MPVLDQAKTFIHRGSRHNFKAVFFGVDGMLLLLWFQASLKSLVFLLPSACSFTDFFPRVVLMSVFRNLVISLMISKLSCSILSEFPLGMRETLTIRYLHVLQDEKQRLELFSQVKYPETPTESY